MNRISHKVLTAIAVGISVLSASCNDYETYAEQKDKEKENIQKFIDGNDITGRIKVISEAKFKEQGNNTNVASNEYVLFDEDGIYMQIVNKGGGKNMPDLAREMPDSTVSKVLLCRFMEYDIQNADTTALNLYTPTIVDKMLCTYSCYKRSYTASFTEGYMLTNNNNNSSVPKGWLKPLDYVGLTRDPGDIAKVRLIVPHSSGTNNASTYVMPYYYEISYQLGR